MFDLVLIDAFFPHNRVNSFDGGLISEHRIFVFFGFGMIIGDNWVGLIKYFFGIFQFGSASGEVERLSTIKSNRML